MQFGCNRRKGFKTHWDYNINHYLCFCLCRNENFHHHVLIVHLPNSAIVSKVLEKFTIRDINNWVIQELLLADLAKPQYTRDEEGPYSYINLDQHR